LPGSATFHWRQEKCTYECQQQQRWCCTKTRFFGNDTSQKDFSLIHCPQIVVATNVAETSITIDDVTAVIDTGRVKQTGYDPARGIAGLQVPLACQHDNSLVPWPPAQKQLAPALAVEQTPYWLPATDGSQSSSACCNNQDIAA
jgi:hypothetical protein